MMWTATFWKAAGERSIKTFAQASVAFLTAEATGILDVDWGQGASVAGLAALVSLLTSVASSGVGSPGPGLGSAETLTTDMVEL